MLALRAFYRVEIVIVVVVAAAAAVVVVRLVLQTQEWFSHRIESAVLFCNVVNTSFE